MHQLREGRSFITNGPLLRFKADSSNIGDTISLVSPKRIRLHGTGIGRQDFGYLELIYNGRVIYKVPSIKEAGHFSATLNYDFIPEEAGWLSLRIPSNIGFTELGHPLFAHTSPIYIKIEGKNIFRPEIAKEMLSEIKQNIEMIKVNGRFETEEEYNKVIDIYNNALNDLEQRMSMFEVSN